MDSYQFKITIGFPVYNVEKYVYKSFKSILDQEFDSFEVIVVDDCGNDQSMDIIRELTNEHPRGNIVHLVKHTKNAGLAEARNTAINNASGKYIYFVDSDDYLTPNALTTLYMTAEKYQAEVVIGSNYQQYDDKLLTKILPDKHFLDENEFKNYYYYSLKDILYSTAWNILFNIDFLNKYNLRFPNIRFQEDIAFDELYRPFIQRIVLISDITYYYLIRKDSLMNFQHRDAIGINEAQRSVELCNLIKNNSKNWKGDYYHGGICAKVLKRCFFQIAGILKHRDKFSEELEDNVIRNMIKHPESLFTILRFRQLKAYNLFCYIIGILPPKISVAIIYNICKKKGYLKTYNQ